MIDNKNAAQFKTKSGLAVCVRPLRTEDAPYLVDLFEHMSAESRYNRFLQPAEDVDIDRIWTEAEKIARMVGDNSHGYAAFTDLPDQPNAVVGAARYVEISSAQAEIAVSVRDDMQNQGIGTILLDLLIKHAERAGIDQLVGTIQNSNTNMWALLKKLERRLVRQPEGNYSFVTIYINETPSHIEDWEDTAADYSPEPQIIW